MFIYRFNYKKELTLNLSREAFELEIFNNKSVMAGDKGVTVNYTFEDASGTLVMMMMVVVVVMMVVMMIVMVMVVLQFLSSDFFFFHPPSPKEIQPSRLGHEPVVSGSHGCRLSPLGSYHPALHDLQWGFQWCRNWQMDQSI